MNGSNRLYINISDYDFGGTARRPVESGASELLAFSFYLLFPNIGYVELNFFESGASELLASSFYPFPNLFILYENFVIGYVELGFLSLILCKSLETFSLEKNLLVIQTPEQSKPT